jgi:hypothetical protein
MIVTGSIINCHTKRDELIDVIKVLPEKALLEVLDYVKYKLKVKD